MGKRGAGSAFISLSPLHFQQKTSNIQASASACRARCRCCDGTGQVSRRSLLQKSLLATSAFILGAIGNQREPANARDENIADSSSEASCRNCEGSGKVICELCSGTGFWRALQGTNPNQKYQGVVCPECEGTGKLTCPVCLGTGEGNVRGLLRRRTVEPGPGRILQTN